MTVLVGEDHSAGPAELALDGFWCRTNLAF
jgi:hypothetical protein